MTQLLLYHESGTRRQDQYADQLASAGVRLERWTLRSPIAKESRFSWVSSEEILSHYSAEIDKVKTELGFANADLVVVDSHQNSSISLRDKYLSEHVHDDHEVRLFISGEALIFVNIQNRVHALHCLPGDFVMVPKGVPHWLDMGPNPAYQCIRWFNDRSALRNQLTGSYIAEATPRWEAILGH